MTYYTITETLVRVVEIDQNRRVVNKLDIAKKEGCVIIGRYKEKLADKRDIELLEEYRNNEMITTRKKNIPCDQCPKKDNHYFCLKCYSEINK